MRKLHTQAQLSSVWILQSLIEHLLCAGTHLHHVPSVYCCAGVPLSLDGRLVMQVHCQVQGAGDRFSLSIPPVQWAHTMLLHTQLSYSHAFLFKIGPLIQSLVDNLTGILGNIPS